MTYQELEQESPTVTYYQGYFQALFYYGIVGIKHSIFNWILKDSVWKIISKVTELLIAIYTTWINFLSVIYSQLIAKLDSVNAISDDLETSKFQRGADPWTQHILASYCTPPENSIFF